METNAGRKTETKNKIAKRLFAKVIVNNSFGKTRSGLFILSDSKSITSLITLPAANEKVTEMAIMKTSKFNSPNEEDIIAAIITEKKVITRLTGLTILSIALIFI